MWHTGPEALGTFFSKFEKWHTGPEAMGTDLLCPDYGATPSEQEPATQIQAYWLTRL